MLKITNFLSTHQDYVHFFQNEEEINFSQGSMGNRKAQVLAKIVGEKDWRVFEMA